MNLKNYNYKILFIWIFIGVLQMDYDDNYNPSHGEYGSWKSMNDNQKIYFLAFVFWNFLNLIALIYILLKLYKKYKIRTT